MYRSTEETTARLRSVNLKLTFDIYYDSQPVVVKYNGKKIDEVNFSIKSINQKEQIEFEGFVPDDPRQKISCVLWHEDNKVDMAPISSLQMQNNQYVTNKKIDNCNEVHFNGVLGLDFSKQWFKHNILSGANLDDGFTNWNQINFTNEEIFCIGDSFTYGGHVARNETWPSMINGKICNFGSNGLSHDGCLQNIKHILHNSNSVKQVICLLPSPTRKLFEFDFLGCVCTIPISLSHPFDKNLPKVYSQDIKIIRDYIIDGNINEDWIDTCNSIIGVCNEYNIDCWLSTWDREMYPHIPKSNRLPMFPALETFDERGADGVHPHRKHYELFVKIIKPYIDKKKN